MENLGKIAAQRLKAAREVRGLTQAELADYLGLSRDAISKIENGRSSLTLRHLEQLPKILHFSIQYFLGLDTNLTLDEEELLALYRSLPATGPTRRFARVQVQGLVEAMRLIEEEGYDKLQRELLGSATTDMALDNDSEHNS